MKCLFKYLRALTESLVYKKTEKLQTVNERILDLPKVYTALKWSPNHHLQFQKNVHNHPTRGQ